MVAYSAPVAAGGVRGEGTVAYCAPVAAGGVRGEGTVAYSAPVAAGGVRGEGRGGGGRGSADAASAPPRAGESRPRQGPLPRLRPSQQRHGVARQIRAWPRQHGPQLARPAPPHCRPVTATVSVLFFSRPRDVTHPFTHTHNLDFTEARDSEWQWHQLGHMQVCTLFQTDNHASTLPLSFLKAGCPSCRPTNSVKALKARSSRYHFCEISSGYQKSFRSLDF